MRSRSKRHYKLELIIKERRLKWLVHTLHMDDARLAKQAV